jgi:hypothetical protein
MMAIRDLNVASSWLASALAPPLKLSAISTKVIAPDEPRVPYHDFTLWSDPDLTSRRLGEVRA